MLNHLIRGLLFHYKKVLFCFNFIWKGCFKKMHHLFFRVRANDVNSTKSQPKIFIWWINKMTSDKRWQAKFSGIVLRWKQFLSFKNCRSVSICSVLNRSNRDTTVYYRLIFCAFSWPNMVKWRNSGIILVNILRVFHLSNHLVSTIHPSIINDERLRMSTPAQHTHSRWGDRIPSCNRNSKTRIINPKLRFNNFPENFELHLPNKLADNNQPWYLPSRYYKVGQILC